MTPPYSTVSHRRLRTPVPTSAAGLQPHNVVSNLHVPVGWDHIDDSRQQRFLAGDGADRQRTATRQYFAQMAGICGVEVLSQHEGRWKIGWQGGDQLVEQSLLLQLRSAIDSASHIELPFDSTTLGELPTGEAFGGWVTSSV
jgi:hypothetical protein